MNSKKKKEFGFRRKNGDLLLSARYCIDETKYGPKNQSFAPAWKANSVSILPQLIIWPKSGRAHRS